MCHQMTASSKKDNRNRGLLLQWINEPTAIRGSQDHHLQVHRGNRIIKSCSCNYSNSRVTCWWGTINFLQVLAISSVCKTAFQHPKIFKARRFLDMLVLDLDLLPDKRQDLGRLHQDPHGIWASVNLIQVSSRISDLTLRWIEEWLT